MINLHDNYWIPSEGYAYLTNGEVVSDGIYLGRGASIEDWWDTNDEEVNTSTEDKAAAYDILTGGAQ